MKGQTRNIYPGGNTPVGFYSYYNYILEQRKAEKIFCLKGGPGTGKSTLLKSIGNYFLEKGEDVDFFWCSSDPDSLDGVLLKKRAIALMDATSPHIVDPKNPGAVDEIVNLGELWNEENIRKNRKKIIECNEKIAETFKLTYGYLGIAGKQYEFMAELMDKIITEEKFYDIKKMLNMKLNSLLVLRRAESKMSRESAMGVEPMPGKSVKFFAGAITPGGIKSGLSSIAESIDKLILINVPVGFRTEKLLEPAAERLTDAGLDIEKYYCPMSPEKKLEHIVVPEGGFAVICCNSYHRINSIDLNKKVMIIDADFEKEKNPQITAIWEDMLNESEKNIDKALQLLKKAKEYHDQLESYYIPNMDFERMEDIKLRIIDDILSKS